jgi:hypothetical protein
MAEAVPADKPPVGGTGPGNGGPSPPNDRIPPATNQIPPSAGGPIPPKPPVPANANDVPPVSNPPPASSSSVAPVIDKPAAEKGDKPAATPPVDKAAPPVDKTTAEKVDKPAAVKTEADAPVAAADKKPEEKKSGIKNLIQKIKDLRKENLLERGVQMAGFGAVLEAWKQKHNRTRAVWSALGHKVADMVAGSLVGNSFRLIAITLVAALIGGVSSWASIGLLALAAGASSAVYTYGKNYLSDKFTGPKDKRAQAKFFDKPRAFMAGRAFLSGTANGAFGAWLARLPLFQHIMHRIHDHIHATVKSVTPDFNSSAAPPAKAAGPGLQARLETFFRKLAAPFNAAARHANSVPPPVLRRPAPHLSPG